MPDVKLKGERTDLKDLIVFLSVASRVHEGVSQSFAYSSFLLWRK